VKIDRAELRKLLKDARWATIEHVVLTCGQLEALLKLVDAAQRTVETAPGNTLLRETLDKLAKTEATLAETLLFLTTAEATAKQAVADREAAWDEMERIDLLLIDHAEAYDAIEANGNDGADIAVYESCSDGLIDEGRRLAAERKDS